MKKKISKYKKVVPANKCISLELFNKIQRSIPIVCVDLVFLRRGKGTDTEILLFKRRIYPEIGKWCIIGGRLIKGERLLEGINRQIKRELGIGAKIISPWNSVRPIGIFDDPKIDPQKHPIILVYPLLVKAGKYNEFGPEFSEIKWFSIKKIPKKLAFNHLKEINHTIKILKINHKIPFK